MKSFPDYHIDDNPCQNQVGEQFQSDASYLFNPPRDSKDFVAKKKKNLRFHPFGNLKSQNLFTEN